MVPSFVPLLADVDIGELIKLIIIFLIFIVPAIGQILAKVRRVQPPAGGAKPKVPPQAPGREVAEEIEQFLRRVAGKQQAVKPPGPVAPQQATAKQAARPEPARQTVKPAVRPPQPSVQVQPVAQKPLGGEIEEHVKKRLSTKEFQERTRRLGGEVAQVDRQIEQHLHKVFDHDLSQVAATPGVAAAEPGKPPEKPAIELPPTLAAGLPALLSSGMAISQAIVLSEIIRRPEERWK